VIPVMTMTNMIKMVSVMPMTMIMVVVVREVVVGYTDNDAHDEHGDDDGALATTRVMMVMVVRL